LNSFISAKISSGISKVIFMASLLFIIKVTIEKSLIARRPEVKNGI
jgi:hypothetical protein